MRLLPSCVAVTLGLLISSVAQAAAPPKDRIPPSKPTVDVASAAGVQRPTFQFGSRDNRTSSLKIRFRCAVDGIPLHPCARTYKVADTLPFGKHSIRVVALDATGNVTRPTIAPFNVIGTWDAASDFAGANSPQNPAADSYGNTVWSYLDSPSLTHDPTQYIPLPHFRAFNSSAWEWDAGVRSDGSVITPLVGVQGSQMSFHPDRDGFAVLAWRSPFAGKVNIGIGLRFPDPVVQAQSNGIVWSLDRGNTTLKSDLLMPTGEAHAEVLVDVAVGDSFYLVIQNNGDSNWDSTIGGFRVRTIP
jgi:hypothetical protein